MTENGADEHALVNDFSKLVVPFADSISANVKRHAVHCMIFADWDGEVLRFPAIAAVLMQMRFDGHLGFPGGEVDESLIGRSADEAKEIILQALVRELLEEMHIDKDSIKMTTDDYLFTHKSESDIFLHFYAFKVSLSKIQEIEKNIVNCREYAREVMGIFRVPLFTMEDGYRGFPGFLNNAFIGTAKQQLLSSLDLLNIMPKKELSRVINSSMNGAKRS